MPAEADAFPALPRVPPAAPVPHLPDGAALDAWFVQNGARHRRLGRSTLALRAVAVAGDPALDAETHAALMRACARRLRSRVRATDEVVSVGADAFGVLLVGAPSHAGAMVAARLAQACAHPFGVGDRLLALRLEVAPAGERRAPSSRHISDTPLT